MDDSGHARRGVPRAAGADAAAESGPGRYPGAAQGGRRGRNGAGRRRACAGKPGGRPPDGAGVQPQARHHGDGAARPRTGFPVRDGHRLHRHRGGRHPAFWRWKSLLKDAGISRIDGRIIGDGRAYEGHLENTTWGYDDTGTYYGAGCNALSYYENAIDYLVSAGAAGEPVKVTQRFPDTPWMHFSNRTETGPMGTGNSLYLYTTDLAPYAEMRGTYAIDRKPKVEHFANKYGALTCAYYFWQNLHDTGWDISGGYADIDRGGYVRGADFVPTYKAGSPQVLGQSASPVLAKIVRQTNVLSDNFYAEAIFRQMGEKASGIAVYDSCRVAVYDVLEDLMESDLAGIRLEDGSGLSRLNSASPAFFVSFLRSMTRSRGFEAFLASFPQPGEGTLSTLLPKLPADQKSRIRVKSGSMDGVLCYSGYILDETGKPARIFSLMVNGATAKTAALRETLGDLIEAML